MSSKHQSRLFAALAAIAFALVAVVGMPRPALADTAQDALNITTAGELVNVIKACASNTANNISEVDGEAQLSGGVTISEATGANGSGNFLVYINGDITLDLNGNTLTMQKCMIVCGEGTLTIEDSKNSGGKVTRAGGIPVQVGRIPEGSGPESGGLTLSSGTISETGAAMPTLAVIDGTADLNGGSITNSGTSTYASPEQPNGPYSALQIGSSTDNVSPVVNLNGTNVTASGTYSKSDDSATGAAVYVASGDVTMTKGTLVGGGSSGKLSLSAVQVGSENTQANIVFTMKNGTIRGSAESPTGTAPSQTYSGTGGGIFVNGNGELNIEGGNVYGSRCVDLNGSLESEYDGSATINISGGTFVASSGSACFYLPSTENGQDTVVISGGTISGGAGIVNLGANVTIKGNPGPTITATATGSVSAGSNAFQYPPSGVVNFDASGDNYNSQSTTTVEGGTINGGITNGVNGTGSNLNGDTQLTVTGGTVNPPKDGAAITNNSGNTTVSGTAEVNGSVVNGAASPIGDGYTTPPTLDINGGTIGDPESAGSATNTVTNNAGTTTMTDGTVNGSVTNNAGTTNLNSGTVKGNVNNADSSKGSLNVGQQGSSNGPTINGEATGEGTTVNSGTVTGGVSGGAVSAPSTPTPGAGTTVDNYVQGAVGPVQSAASGYANVTVSSDLKTWTVDVTDAGDETPLSTVANNVVAQVISAIQRGGSGKVTSGSLSLDLPASLSDIQAFALKVLQAAIGIPTAATDGPVASDLIGRTVTLTATTNTGSITYTFAFTGEGAPVTVYRLWNKLNGAHLFTSDQNEYNVLTAEHPGEWIGEGARFTEPATGTEPVYRLYNPNNGDHFFTKSKAEADTLSTIGWRIESANWYSGGDVDVMRFYNPSQTANEGLGNHLWTAEAPEIAALPSMGYVAEGLGWNALSVLQ